MAYRVGDASVAEVTREEWLLANSLLRTATMQMARKEHEAAARTLSQALERVPSHAESLGALAVCLATSQSRYVTAEKLAKRAIRLAPGNPAGYLALGQVYRLGSRREPAIHYLKRARELAPGDLRIKAELEALGEPTEPVVSDLSENHPVNVQLGRMRRFLLDTRHRLLVGMLAASLCSWVICQACG